jgi:hypothetical protein
MIELLESRLIRWSGSCRNAAFDPIASRSGHDGAATFVMSTNRSSGGPANLKRQSAAGSVRLSAKSATSKPHARHNLPKQQA